MKRFEFINTPTREVVAEICEAYALTLDEPRMTLDGVVSASFSAASAHDAVAKAFESTPFSGWIQPGWVPGEVLIIHDRRALDETMSYEHDSGSLHSLLRAIPELFSLGVCVTFDELKAVEEFSVRNQKVRDVLDLACGKAGLRWKEERGVIFVSRGGLDPAPWPVPEADSIF